MQCSPLKTALNAVRYFMFPRSRTIDIKTQEIEQNIEELRIQKAKTSEMVRRVTQPDVLRSLVISMNSTSKRHRNAK